MFSKKLWKTDNINKSPIREQNAAQRKINSSIENRVAEYILFDVNELNKVVTLLVLDRTANGIPANKA